MVYNAVVNIRIIQRMNDLPSPYVNADYDAPPLDSGGAYDVMLVKPGAGRKTSLRTIDASNIRGVRDCVN